MSRTSAPMQYILDLLTDGILTSQHRQIGYTPIDRITSDQLPFVQVFTPTISTPTPELTQPVGDLTISLEIFNIPLAEAVARAALGPAEPEFLPFVDMQRVIDQLSHTLSIDSSMDGLVAHASVAESGLFTDVGEHGMQMIAMSITVELANETRPEYIEFVSAQGVVFNFEDVNNFGTLSGTATLEQSRTVPGAVAFRRDGGFSAVMRGDTTTFGGGGGPWDLSVTKFMRLLLYQDRQAAEGSVNIEIHIGDRNSGNHPLADYRKYLWTMSWHGWQEIIFDLSQPTTTVGSPADLDAVEAIHFLSVNFGAPVTTTFGMVFSKFGYFARDTGDNDGIGPSPNI